MVSLLPLLGGLAIALLIAGIVAYFVIRNRSSSSSSAPTPSPSGPGAPSPAAPSPTVTPSEAPVPSPSIAPAGPAPVPAPTPTASPTAPLGGYTKQTIVDCGYAAKTRGWFDIDNEGVRNDYCRYVGSSEGESYFSCAMAGSSNPYTAPGEVNYTGQQFDALTFGDRCYQGICPAGYTQVYSTTGNPTYCTNARSCPGLPYVDLNCNCACQLA